MKLTLICFAIALTFLFSCKPNKRAELFNNRNLNNWTAFLKDPGVDPDTVFWVKDGIINVSGQPFGYLRSNEVYSNYKLHVEYRWVKEPANSGIFLHVQGENRIWPLCYECQLWNGHAGDVILMGLGMGMTVKDSTFIVTPGGPKQSMVMPKFADSTEKPAGEWNSLDITCESDNLEVIINGVLQNMGKKLTASSGSICLQSEGGPMQFRNIKLEQLEPGI
jgi:hypothetical protein